MTVRNWLDDDHEFDTGMKVIATAMWSVASSTKASMEMNLKTEVGRYTISTVKLVCNHGDDDRPLWFETMVNDGESWDGEGIQYRYATLEQAEAGHAQVVWAYKQKVLKQRVGI